jgi:hypothetical protein
MDCLGDAGPTRATLERGLTSMPSILIHLAAVERLAAGAGDLPTPYVRALEEDVEYARFGAALADLPSFEGLSGGVRGLLSQQQAPRHFTRLFHERAPVALGLKLAELVGLGALVGKEPGRAFIAGYFCHLCVDRALLPVLNRLAQKRRRPGENEEVARRRVTWERTQAYLRELHGREMIGNPALRSKFQLSKRPGLPARGIGRGLYELVRLASQETLGEAPPKSAVDGWVRGLYFYGLVLGSPLGRSRIVDVEEPPMDAALFASAIDAGLVTAGATLRELHSLIERTRFSARARGRFLEALPEAALRPCDA